MKWSDDSTWWLYCHPRAPVRYWLVIADRMASEKIMCGNESRPLGLQHLTHFGFQSGCNRIAGALWVFQLWDNQNTFRCIGSMPILRWSILYIFTKCSVQLQVVGPCISLTNVAFFKGDLATIWLSQVPGFFRPRMAMGLDMPQNFDYMGW